MLLGLLVVLGIVGMHGTPAMAGSSMPPSADHTSMATHAVSVMAGLSPTAGARAPTGIASPPERGHDQLPAEHHMLTPCLAKVAPVVLLGGHHRGLTEVAPAQPTLLTSVAAEITARDRGRPPSPPDLQKLCISRT